MNLFEHSKINSLEIAKAARIVGISIVIMAILATIVDDFVLSNLIVPGADSDTLSEDIEADRDAFIIATILYLVILLLDAVIAVALYGILKAADKTLASLTGYLRLLYAGSVAVILIAFAIEIIEANTYEIVKLFGYLFFVSHIFVAGYTVYKSNYIPRLLGILLVIASFCYIIAFYINIVVEIPDPLMVIFMLFMAAGELSLAVWLFIRANVLTQLIESTVD
jgi:hypothetical protein